MDLIPKDDQTKKSHRKAKISLILEAIEELKEQIKEQTELIKILSEKLE